MKYRNGFVSNSSSCSFIITNTTNEERTLLDFVEENLDLVDDYVKIYGFIEKDNVNFLKLDILRDATNEDKTFKPGESKEMLFGDNDGTAIGRIYDYILREGGNSESFKWKFSEMLR